MSVETITPLYLSLQRYAGWLDRARASVAVETEVATLGTAIGTGGEISALLTGLDTSIGHLPTGAIRKMLRGTVAEIRRAFEAQG